MLTLGRLRYKLATALAFHNYLCFHYLLSVGPPNGDHHRNRFDTFQRFDILNFWSYQDCRNGVQGRPTELFASIASLARKRLVKNWRNGSTRILSGLKPGSRFAGWTKRRM
jgi:hypothetical protein